MQLSSLSLSLTRAVPSGEAPAPPPSPVTISYVSIKDSTATPADTFFAENSTDAGNNTGWTFL